MKKNNGGYVFPDSESHITRDGLRKDKGLTKRDYFAGQAITGILMSDCSYNMDVGARADLAYRIADAMLVEREKGL